MTGRSMFGSKTPVRLACCSDCGTRLVHERPRRSLPLILGLCALVFLALTSGCSKETPAQQRDAGNTAQAQAEAQRLKAAKTAAALVLADVGACESAVIAGSSLGVLSRKASHARDSAQAFSHSENGKLIPKVASAILLAAQEYDASCVMWREDEKALAESQKKVLRSKEDQAPPATSSHEAMWVQAGIDLGKARIALRDATL